MSFLKNNKKLSLVLVFFFFSCQSLKTNKNSSQLPLSGKNQIENQKAQINKKTQNQTQESLAVSSKLKSFSVNQEIKKSPVIDNNYLDYSTDLAYLKAETAFLEKKTDLALDQINKAQIFSRKPAHLIERTGDFYKKEGLLTESIHYYKKWIQRYGEEPRIRKKIMECYVLNGLNDLALKENERLLKKEPDSFLLGFQKSILFMGEKKWEESLKLFEQLLAQKRSLEEASQILAFQSYALNELGRKKLALKSFHRLLELDFPSEPVALRIGDLYRKTGKEDWSIAYVSQFQIKSGITKYNSSFLFDVAFSSGDWGQAFQQTENLEALGSLNQPHRFYRAFYLSELKKYDLSIPYLKDLLTEEPNNGQYQRLLAVSYEKTNQPERALAVYKKVSSSSPYFLISALEQARLLEKQGELEESLSLLKSLVDRETMSPLAVSEYAKSLWRLGERKQALFVLTSALEQAPSNSELLNLKSAYSEKLSFVESVL